jgi:hypothetical protein
LTTVTALSVAVGNARRAGINTCSNVSRRANWCVARSAERRTFRLMELTMTEKVKKLVKFGGTDIEVTIDVDLLVYEMCRAVTMNKTGKTTLLFGAVKAKKVTQEQIKADILAGIAFFNRNCR